MIDAIELGRILAEEVTNPAGPCLYPGKFHPPHKGHFKAVQNLASRNYITEVIIILSAKTSPETGNITPEQALQIWKMYLQAQPIPKVKLQISEHESPVVDMIHIIQRNPNAQAIYVAGGSDERDDQSYLQSLQNQFGRRVRAISINEKDGAATAPHIRTLVQQRDYERFKDTIPPGAFNKGAAPKVWKLLTASIPPGQPEEQQPQQQIEPTSDQGQGTN